MARSPLCVVCEMIALVLSVAAAATMPPALDVSFGDDAAFSVSLAGRRWLESGPLRAFAAGTWQNLTRTGAARSSGADALGSFDCVNVSWSWPPAGVLHTSLKTYAGQDMAVFVQQLPRGAARTNASSFAFPGGVRVMDPGNYPPVVAFPSFEATKKELQSLGYLTWQSRMVTAEWGTNVTRCGRCSCCRSWCCSWCCSWYWCWCWCWCWC